MERSKRSEKEDLKEKRIAKAIEVVDDLSRICEYFYRKGVLDGAVCGDPVEVNLCAKREDDNTTFRFLRDEGGRNVPYRHYLGYVQFFCSKIGANDLRNAIAFIPGQRTFFTAVCVICDKYYRDGLLDGVKIDFLEAKKYFNENPRYSRHNRLIGSGYDNTVWIDSIKYDCNRIFLAQETLGKNMGLNRLATYISRSIRNSYDGWKYI